MLLPYAEIIPALEQASFDTTTTLGRYFYYSIWLNVGQGKSSVTLTPADLQQLKERYPALFLENNILATWFSDQPSQTKLLALYQLKQNAVNQNRARLRRLTSYYLVKTYQGEGSYLNAIIELHNVMKIAPPATAKYDWYDYSLIDIYSDMAYSMYGIGNNGGELEYCYKTVNFLSDLPTLDHESMAKAMACQIGAQLRMSNFSGAEQALKRLNELALNTRLTEVKVTTLIQFAIFFRAQEKYALASSYAQNVIDLQQQIGIELPNTIYTAYKLMALSQLDLGNLNAAKSYLQAMETERGSLEKGTHFDIEAIVLKARIENKTGNYDTAGALYEKAISMFGPRSVQPVSDMNLLALQKDTEQSQSSVVITKNRLHQTRAEQMTLVAVFTTALVIVGGALIWYLMRHKQQLEAFARTDSLTRLYNRGYCMSLAEKLLETASPDKPVCLALIDIDHFKQINDRYGHQTGDKVLTGFGKQLQQWCGKNHLAGRYGGEEFLLILPDTTLESAQTALGKLRERLQDAGADTPASTGPVTFSGGLVQVTHQANIEPVIRLCDTLLYQAKQNGRNAVYSRTLLA